MDIPESTVIKLLVFHCNEYLKALNDLSAFKYLESEGAIKVLLKLLGKDVKMVSKELWC